MQPLEKEGLRECQVEAITALEQSLAAGRPRALVQMTMGAGKTSTAATQTYRLLAQADRQWLASLYRVDGIYALLPLFWSGGVLCT